MSYNMNTDQTASWEYLSIIFTMAGPLFLPEIVLAGPRLWPKYVLLLGLLKSGLSIL